MNDELVRWTGPQGLPRFDLIADDDFAPAFDAALAEAAATHEAIAANHAAPDFANTIAAMETADEALGRVASVFYTLAGLASNPAREDLQRELAPKLAAHHARIAMDPRLYARVQEVAAGADALAPQDRRITDLALRDMRRAGAAGELTGSSRAWEFGDTQTWDVTRTITNAIQRTVGEGGDPSRGMRLRVEDVEVQETEARTQAAVALLVDTSFSMEMEGRWTPMKRTAIALNHLISTRFRSDELHLIAFGRYARSIDIAARSSDEVASNIAQVSQASSSTGAAASQVLTSATEPLSPPKTFA